MNYKEEQNQLLLKKCREHGLKITPQRCAIFSELIRDKSHPTAEQVFKRVKNKLPNVSFDTVNRTLLSLADIGLLEIVASRDKAKRFDPNTGTHNHFQCIKCLTLIDFEDNKLNKIHVPSSLNENVILNKSIILEGVCKNCK